MGELDGCKVSENHGAQQRINRYGGYIVFWHFQYKLLTLLLKGQLRRFNNRHDLLAETVGLKAFWESNFFLTDWLYL